MEEYIGLLIFAVIAIGSWIMKAREQRMEAERRKNRVERQDVELPEATRRMLYGGETIPTAQPKREQSQDGMEEEGWQPVTPPPRPQQRPQPPQRQEPRRTPVQEQQRPRQTQPTAAPRRSLQDLWQDAQRRIEAELERQQQAQHPQPPVQRPQPQRPTAVPKRARREETHVQRYTREEEEALQRRRAEEAQRRKKQAALAAQWERERVARRKGNLAHMLTNSADIRRGIVLQEILGPPKALRNE